MLYKLFYIVIYMTLTGSIVWLSIFFLNKLFKYRLSIKLLMLPFLFYLLPIKDFSTSLIDNDPTHDFLPAFKSVAIIWALGVLINIIYIILIAIITRYKIMKLKTCKNVQVLKAVKFCSETLCISRDIKLYESQSVSSVRLYGVINPCIIISHDIYNSLDTEEMNMIFLHELNHLKNYDMQLRWFVRFICCIHWFNPLIWLAYKSCEGYSEMCCDRNVIVTLKDKDNIKGKYARLIIKLLEIASRDRKIPLSAGISSYENIRMRLEGIIEPQKDINKFMSSLIITSIISLALWIVTSFSLNYFYNSNKYAFYNGRNQEYTIEFSGGK